MLFRSCIFPSKCVLSLSVSPSLSVRFFLSLSLFCLRHSLEHIKNVFGYEMLCHVVSCRWWIHFVYFYACRWFGHHYQSRALDSFCLMLWMCVCVCCLSSQWITSRKPVSLLFLISRSTQNKQHKTKIKKRVAFQMFCSFFCHSVGVLALFSLDSFVVFFENFVVIYLSIHFSFPIFRERINWPITHLLSRNKNKRKEANKRHDESRWVKV